MAADLNQVILIGRLTRDAELRYTASGMAICKFSLAVNRRRKQGDQWVEEGNFFDVTLWGRQGEALNQYLTKGKQIGLQGELRQDRWEQDGQPRSKVEIVANNVQLLGGGGAASSGQPQQWRPQQEQARTQPQQQGGQQQTTAQPQAGTPPMSAVDEGEPFDDDIPF